MSPITFRNSKIVYYGPHTCENCGVLIVKMGREWGGTAFTNPQGPIYPNTEWHPHVCDPDLVRARKALFASARVVMDFPNANTYKTDTGFVVLGEIIPGGVAGGSYLAITPNLAFYDTEDAAWMGALERLENEWPTWHIDIQRFNTKRVTRDILESLPQIPPDSK